ncbi:MAG: hypothetical protein IPQ18_10145 [Saprospiraceae bacterium]|jgi:predicted NUDIX family NTP pyrophosphohydrolase|nr:hypothetical protein [Saprospiraceae bacterium]MBL0191680.1 hypothetical protein [Saprospiraceae bacterium]MBL0293830.1 hypothetical protein [Saprospiraceae bacterium]
MGTDFIDQVKLIIYRFKEKGLEVFMVNDLKNEWELPEGGSEHFQPHRMIDQGKVIHLDPIKQADGQLLHAYAIEGDWHEIPSIRGMIYDDVHFVKNKIVNAIPTLDEGTFLQAKEAFKKARPQEYAFLKELKDILCDRNAVSNI